MKATSLLFAALFAACASPLLAQQGEIIVESSTDGQNFASFQKVDGSWLESTAKSKAPGLKGAVAMYKSLVAGGAARFVPDIPADGKYDVYVTYPESGNASGVIHKVHSASGDREIVLDQNGRAPDADPAPNVWIPLGTYEFKKGSDGYVEIRDPGTGKGAFSREPNTRIYADSAKFVPNTTGQEIAAAVNRPVEDTGAAPAPAAAAAPPTMAAAPAAAPGMPPMPDLGGTPAAPATDAAAPKTDLPPLTASAAATPKADLPPLAAAAPAGQPNLPASAALPPLPAAAAAAATPALPSLQSAATGQASPAAASANETPSPTAGTAPALPPLGSAPAVPATSALPPMPGAAPPATDSAAPAAPALPPLPGAPGAGMPPPPPPAPPANTVPGTLPPIFAAPEASTIATTAPGMMSPPVPGAPTATASLPAEPSLPPPPPPGMPALPPAGGLPPVGDLPPIPGAGTPPPPSAPPAMAGIPGAGDLSWVFDIGAAQTIAEKSNKPILVFFTAEGNKRQAKYEAEFFSDPSVRSQLDRFVLMRSDFPSNTRYAYKLGVYGAGNIVVIDRTEEVKLVVDEMPATPDELAKKFEGVK